MNLAFLNDKAPLEAALHYATGLGWPVFPLHSPIGGEGTAKCSCGRDGCENVGKHPRTPHGYEDATKDPDIIRGWWRKWPHANIGVCTGINFLVVDVDDRGEGLSNFPEVLSFEPGLRDTLSVQTGGGGRHFFARIPRSAGAVNNRTKVWDGIDIRADGGYVVAPPSLHASLKRYQWLPVDAAMVELSEAFIEKIRLPKGEPISRGALRNSVIPRGQRNDVLFRMAASRSARGNEDFEDTLSFVRRANHERCDPPLEEEEVVRIVTSAYSYPPSFLHTDLGNARAIAHWFGKDLRWTPALGWLEYADGRWNEVTDVHIRGYAHDLSGMLMTIAKKSDNGELEKWAHLSQNTGRIGAMIKEFQEIAEVRGDLFDASTFLLPCQGGTLELGGEGRFRNSTRDDYMTKRVPIAFDARAKCPRWEEALRLWMDGDEELIEYLRRVVGYCLTGDNRHQCIFILYGKGANGKSTFVRTLRAMLGSFAITMNSEILLRNSSVNRETEIARLLGIRLAVCAESASGRRIDEESVKKLTGGEPIIGRKLYKDAIEFKPTGKIMLHTNNKPRASSYDDALWRRIVPIPFTVVIPQEQQNSMLPWQLLEELPGILAWAVRGTHEERMPGRDVMHFPAAVARAKEEYREENDLVHEFLEESIIVTANKMDRIAAKDLHLRYSEWCHRGRRGSAMDYKKFNAEMRDRQGYESMLFHNATMWMKVRWVGVASAAINLER